MYASAIWQPKYCIKSVLIRCQDVKRQKCFVYFCCDKNLKDLYSYDGDYVRNNCKVVSNGKIPCYQIPLSILVSEGDLPKEFEKIRECEYAKYQRTLKKYKQ